MTSIGKRLVLAFVVLILALAALGTHGQARYFEHARLLDVKDGVLITLAAQRAEAASVNGPLAVSRWARERGMVPAPEARDVIQVAPSPIPPPRPLPLQPSLEVRTIWR